MEPVKSGSVQDQSSDPSMPAETTFQRDLTMAGQRKINLIWEYTQALIALMVITSNVLVSSMRAMGWGLTSGATVAYPDILSNSLFLIVGFYFSRTNHAAIGGIGMKPQTTYTGR